MDLTLEKILPLLLRPPSAGQTPRVSGWVAALNALLGVRYKGGITTAIEPVFIVYCADAIQRRLDKAKQMVDSEGAGPFNVRWNAASSLGGWFLPSEIDEMDDITGGGGTRTYRTPAPDSIRLNNLSGTPFDEFEDEALSAVAQEAIGGT